MRYLLLAFTLFLITPSFAQLKPIQWARNAVIYEVNTRQYSQAGTLAEVNKDLLRLKDLGVDVLWFMPLHPIGAKKRKGTLGSYYSVRDYRMIDPSYGDTVAFRQLVRRAHSMGMKVIVDWVANHTSWDHKWVQEHKNWYVQNETGEIQSQFDWSDVAKLDFKNPEMRTAMIEDMKYWVNHFDIDGFRCDVAFLVPLDFWSQARTELDKVKPMFILAEMEGNTDITPFPENYFRKVFNASYAWTFMGVTQDMAKGKKNVADFRKEMNQNYQRFPKSMAKMFFITNHDENSWNGTVTEKYGDNWKLYATLCYTLPQSMPMIYSGEEAGLNRRLQFFEKDAILPKEWADTSRYNWYRAIIKLRHENPALWNMQQGEDFQEIEVASADTAIYNKVYAFKRTKGKYEVAVITNFSSKDVVIDFPKWIPDPAFKTLFNSKALNKNQNGKWVLKAYNNVVLYK
jgi:glycosidase